MGLAIRWMMNLSNLKLQNQEKVAQAYIEDKNSKIQFVLNTKIKELNQITHQGYLAIETLHDITTPLTTLLICLEEMSLYNTDSNLKTANQAANTLKNLLSQNRNVENQIKESFNLKTEIKKCLNIVENIAITQDIIISCDVCDAIVVRGNSLKMQQLISNLIINAIEALSDIKRDSKKIRLTAQSTEKTVTITVSDNGSGINANKIDKIFNLYYTTKGLKNQGLGLYICKQIVENDFKGEITVESSENMGTTFVVRLPLSSFNNT